jgi:hypothetical protein
MEAFRIDSEALERSPARRTFTIEERDSKEFEDGLEVDPWWI